MMMNAYNNSNNMNPVSPRSSLETVDRSNVGDGIVNAQDLRSREEFPFSKSSRRSYNYNDLGELHQLALRMMRD